MKRLFLLVLILGAVAILGAPAAEAAPLPKVTICHIPPGNPANAHTITISENAWPAHRDNHGDLLGSCDDNCDALCDDGDACTQDVDMSAETCTCLPAPEPVDCNDGVFCTIDSCDPASGSCVYEPSTDPVCTGPMCVEGEPDYDECCELNPDDEGCEPTCADSPDPAQCCIDTPDDTCVEQ